MSSASPTPTTRSGSYFAGSSTPPATACPSIGWPCCGQPPTHIYASSANSSMPPAFPGTAPAPAVWPSASRPGRYCGSWISIGSIGDGSTSSNSSPGHRCSTPNDGRFQRPRGSGSPARQGCDPGPIGTKPLNAMPSAPCAPSMTRTTRPAYGSADVVHRPWPYGRSCSNCVSISATQRSYARGNIGSSGVIRCCADSSGAKPLANGSLSMSNADSTRWKRRSTDCGASTSSSGRSTARAFAMRSPSNSTAVRLAAAVSVTACSSAHCPAVWPSTATWLSSSGPSTGHSPPAPNPTRCSARPTGVEPVFHRRRARSALAISAGPCWPQSPVHPP